MRLKNFKKNNKILLIIQTQLIWSRYLITELKLLNKLSIICFISIKLKLKKTYNIFFLFISNFWIYLISIFVYLIWRDATLTGLFAILGDEALLSFKTRWQVCCFLIKLNVVAFNCNVDEPQAREACKYEL